MIYDGEFFFLENWWVSRKKEERNFGTKNFFSSKIPQKSWKDILSFWEKFQNFFLKFQRKNFPPKKKCVWFKKKNSPFFLFSKRDLECEITLKNHQRTIWVLWGDLKSSHCPCVQTPNISLWFFNQSGSFQHVTNFDASRLTKTTPFCDDFLCSMKRWERKYYFGGKKILRKFISSLFLEKLARYWENYEIWCGKSFSFFKFFQVFFLISGEWTDISGSPEIFTWKLSVSKKSHEFFPELSRKESAF